MRLYNAHSCTPVGSKSTLKSTIKPSPARYLPAGSNDIAKRQVHQLKGIYDMKENVDSSSNQRPNTLGAQHGFYQSRLTGQGQICKPIVSNYKLFEKHSTPDETPIKASSTDETDATSHVSSVDEVSVHENSIIASKTNMLQAPMHPSKESSVGPWSFTISSSFSSDSEWSDWQNRAKALGEIQGEQPSAWSDSGVGSDGFPLDCPLSLSNSDNSVNDVNNWPKPHRFYPRKKDALIPEGSLLDSLPSSFSSSVASDDEQSQLKVGRESHLDTFIEGRGITSCSSNHNIALKDIDDDRENDRLSVEAKSRKPGNFVEHPDSAMERTHLKQSGEPELHSIRSQECESVLPVGEAGVMHNEDATMHTLPASVEGINLQQSIEISIYAAKMFTTEDEEASSDDEKFSSVRSNLNQLSNTSHLDNLKQVLINRQVPAEDTGPVSVDDELRKDADASSGTPSAEEEAVDHPSGMKSDSAGSKVESKHSDSLPASIKLNEVPPNVTQFFVELARGNDTRAQSPEPQICASSVNDVPDDKANFESLSRPDTPISDADGAIATRNVPLKDDPAYAKYFKMLTIGLPMGAVKNAMERDGLDPNIMDGDLDQPVSKDNATASTVSLKNDPAYTKYFKMLSVGLPMDAVKNAMERDGVDPNVMDGDPDKPISTGGATVPKVCLKDNPTYAKYFKMLSVGLPTGAVKNAMERDGLGQVVIDDVIGESSCKSKQPLAAPKDQYRRTRLHWNTHSNVQRHTLWSIIDQDPEVSKVVIDEKEFLSLFQAKLKSTKTCTTPVCQTGEDQHKLLIDRKRANNGGIVLARVKLTYDEIASAIETFNDQVFTQEQINGLLEYVPTEEEQKLLKEYLAQPESTLETLCECEKFMVNMLNISDVQSKLHALSFIKKYANSIDSLFRDASLVRTACEQITTSNRLRKVLGFILNIGNKLNTAGPGKKKKAVAITLDSLLKLDQVKALDKKTTFLRFAASVINRNNPSLVKFKDDLTTVFEAQRIDLGTSLAELKRLSNELEDVRQIALRHDVRHRQKYVNNDDITVNGAGASTSVERFLIDASKKLSSTMHALETAQESFTLLLQYFGEDGGERMDSHEVLQIVATFSNSFDSALEQANAAEKLKYQSKKKMRFSQLKCKGYSEEHDMNLKYHSSSSKQSGANVGAMLKELKSRTKLRLRRGRC